MKKMTFIAFASVAFIIESCGNTATEKTKEFPKPGTVIATAQMPIKDELNNFTFSIKVVADSDVRSGVYDVDADFGPNFASGKFTMPKGGEALQPIIRTGTAPYTYIIGFKVANDTTFYDYFEVSSSKDHTKMQYIKAYSF